MPGTEEFEAVGRIVACLRPGVFRVELPNRHQVLAYAAGRRRTAECHLALGDPVGVELSPFDLSKGRLKKVRAEMDKSA